MMAVVKADAYGHGIETVAAAVSGHVDWFGVANLQEAVCVRRATARMPVPVLILGPALPSERAAIVEGGFCPVISTLEEASAYEAEALRRGLERFELHLAVDTGMGRMGVWEEEAVGLIQAIGGMSSVRLAGLATHFPSADDDAAYTQGQIERFDALVTRMRAEGWSGIVHLANSAGMLRFPECCADLARVGLAIYGCSPGGGGGGVVGGAGSAVHDADLEDTGGAGEGSWAGPFRLLWTYFRDRSSHEGGDASGRVRRWVSAFTFGFRGRGAYSRGALPIAWTRDNGSNHGGC